ncbi:hypothetical protein FQN57_001174 [Myotisia sp. PD_48]|nr:hypothetical protein FQN57_001174 [Myotisia sp. PD_48]
MASSVHFKFKSQKEPSRVTFDGTGISVFELKREIINQNRLGDGSEFELSIYNEDTNEEYDDDTAIIPRSTSVIARRFPAARPGKGGAARYISGKMPLTGRNVSNDAETSSRQLNGATTTLEINNLQSEDEKIKALFQLQESQWKEQQQDMTNMVPIASRGRGKPIAVPDHPPPPGYLCYRCREKGHWIQACPTNNDPRFDGRYRVKRSTGIPRSFQKQVEKPESPAMDGSDETPKLSGVMVNADGDFVIAQPDKASWELYQEKAKATKAAEADDADTERSKQLLNIGLLCPLDNRMLLAPTKTPCCKKTYCSDCITNALIESDFVCPNCSAEGILLDNLSADENAIMRLKEFESEKVHQTEKNEEQRQYSNNLSVSSPAQINPIGNSEPSQELSGSKKRSAMTDENDTSAEQPIAPVMKKNKSSERPFGTQGTQFPVSISSYPQFPLNPIMGQYPPPNTYATHDLSPIPGYYNVNTGWNNTPAPFMNSVTGGPFSRGLNQHIPPSGFGMPPATDFSLGPQMTMNPMPHPTSQNYMGAATFSNPQHTRVEPQTNEEDSPYFRQPVNPHRHHGRQKRTRPSDYREL